MATTLPFADTPAAGMLDQAIKRYTAANPGGLRALAARIGIKQATVLSHMANGRIGIPLDRATQFADILGMDATTFSLAVLQQKDPEIYNLLSTEARKKAAPTTTPFITPEALKDGITISAFKMRLIAEILSTPDDKIRHATGNEAELLNLIRSMCPMGLDEKDWSLVRESVRLCLE